MKKVSIIVPLYNSEKTIEKCINSITKQTYKNIEIIIVNDGSTDDSQKIIEQLEKKDIRIKTLNQQNSGVSVARNNGITNSTGDYIMFIDSDDWIDDNCVEKLVKTINEKKVDAVRYNYIKENRDSSVKQNMYDLSSKKFEGKQVTSEKVISHFLYTKEAIPNYVMLLLIKTEIIKSKIEFDKNLFMMEDVYFYQKFLHNIKSIYFLDEALYHYNNCNISVTRDPKKAIKNIYGIFECSKKIKEYLDAKNTEYSKTKINSCHVNLTITYLNKAIKISNYKSAKKIIIEITENTYFKKMISNLEMNDITKYRKKIIKSINNKEYLKIYIMLKIRKIFKRI